MVEIFFVSLVVQVQGVGVRGRYTGPLSVTEWTREQVLNTQLCLVQPAQNINFNCDHSNIVDVRRTELFCCLSNDCCTDITIQTPMAAYILSTHSLNPENLVDNLLSSAPFGLLFGN